jgi:hypothetical protein
MNKTKLHPFTGKFNRSGSSYQKIDGSPPLVLVIATRKTPSPTKTRHFLLMDYPTGTGRVFVSSLYPTKQEGVYNLEYQGSRYKMAIGPDTAEVYPDSTPSKKAA